MSDNDLKSGQFSFFQRFNISSNLIQVSLIVRYINTNNNNNNNNKQKKTSLKIRLTTLICNKQFLLILITRHTINTLLALCAMGSHYSVMIALLLYKLHMY